MVGMASVDIRLLKYLYRYMFVSLVPDDGPGGIQARVLSASEIQVAWGDVPLKSRNGILLGYKVSVTYLAYVSWKPIIG